MPPTLVLSSDVVGPRMAGSGIRAWQIANALAARQPVILAVPGAFEHPAGAQLPANLRVAIYRWGDDASLRPALAEAEVIVGQGFALSLHDSLLTSGLPLAVDLATPMLLEGLELAATADAHSLHRQYVDMTVAQLRAGDFFFCASERQRDYWLGALSALGRVNPQAYQAEPMLRALIDTVPFGIPDDPPPPARRSRAEILPGVAEQDVVLLWSGGLWDWLDPLILIRAVAALAPQNPRLKLVFSAGPRPNPDGPPFRTAAYDAARRLVAELDVGASVLFLDDWIPYAELHDYLAAADVGVCAHHQHIETHFAFRTRLMDYVWSSLPIITSAGDSVAALVEQHRWGQVVAADDLGGWIAAIGQLAGDAELRRTYRAAILATRGLFTWQAAVRPLERFCQAPQRTAERAPAPEDRHPSPADRMSTAQLQDEIARKTAAFQELEQYARALEQQLAQRQTPLARAAAWLRRRARR